MNIKVSRQGRFCGQVFTGTYKSRYCSNAHKQAAYRRRMSINYGNLITGK